MKNYRVKGAAEYLGVAVSTVWLYTKEGKISAIKLSDRVTVWEKSDLDDFVSRAKAGGAL